MKIAVAGATGRVGRYVVEVLEAGGHEIVPMTRATGVDIITGQGLSDALSGVSTIVDASSGPSPDEASATTFFRTATHNLIEAGTRAGVQRIVVVSIIGIDRFTAGYMKAKQVHEAAMRAGSIPVSILRAAQFHELVGQMVDWGRQGDVAYLPKMRTQLVAARTVGEALAALALESPAAATSATDAIAEIAGPRAEDLVDAATRLMARRGDPVRIVGAANPADPDAALYESGAVLPGPHATLAGPTFQEWLDKTYPVATASRAR